jgi:hypothetical protein
VYCMYAAYESGHEGGDSRSVRVWARMLAICIASRWRAAKQRFGLTSAACVVVVVILVAVVVMVPDVVL